MSILTNNQKVSIVIPTYNRAATIINTLQSIANLNYKYWECLIVDDFSTDNTQEVVNKFIKDDFRFKFITNQRKKGAQGARNTGILNAQGCWVAFLDSDDLFPQNSIYDRIKCVNNNDFHNAKIIYGDIVGHNFEFIRGSASKFISTNIALASMITLMIEKDILLTNLLDEVIPACQDDDLIIEISKKYNVYHCGSVVAQICNVSNSNSISSSRRRIYLAVEILLKKHKKYIVANTSKFWYIILKIRLFLIMLDYLTEANYKLINKLIKYAYSKYIKLFKVTYF